MIDCGRNLILSALKFTGVRTEDRNLMRLATNVIEAAVIRSLGPDVAGRSQGGSSDRKTNRSDSRGISGNLQ